MPCCVDEDGFASTTKNLLAALRLLTGALAFALSVLAFPLSLFAVLALALVTIVLTHPDLQSAAVVPSEEKVTLKSLQSPQKSQDNTIKNY